MLPVELPKQLDPGAAVTYGYNAHELAQSLREARLHISQLRPYAQTGHGRTYGKPLRQLPGT